MLPIEWKGASAERGIRRSWRLTARSYDGTIRWRGWFSDREDADAFLFSMACGSLRFESELWILPTPRWHPFIDEDVTYELVTFNSVTSTSGSNQSYSVPADFNAANNTIQCIGGGGGGGAAAGTNGGGGGGPGGAWASISNAGLTPSGTATFFLGTAASGGSAPNTTASGGAGANTWMRIDGGSTAPASTAQGVLAEGGGQGGVATGVVGTGIGGTGGRTANSIGASKNAGGSGGNGVAASGPAGGGGGGAGGPNGAGNTGLAGSSNGATGGSGDAGSGGSAGTGSSGGLTAGGAGTEIDAVHSTGSGGGGGGRSGTTGTAAAGGNYGAGGGGSGCPAGNTAVGGSATSGLIVVSYTPASAVTGGFNMPMLGM
jgi:hypothetical protein